MALYEYNTLFNNGNKIGGIYKGGNLIWPVKKTGPDYTEPFYVENITNANETLIIKKSNKSALSLTIEYSLNKKDWETLGTTSGTSDRTAVKKTLQPGDKVYLRCNTNVWTQSTKRNLIRGISKVGGNIMSLLYGNKFIGQKEFPTTSTRVFEYVLYGNPNLITASELLLPATKLTESCYGALFRGCTSLQYSPRLQNPVLANSCYSSFFYGCTSLKEVYCMTEDATYNSSWFGSWMGGGVPNTGTFYKKVGSLWNRNSNGIPSGWTVIEV